MYKKILTFILIANTLIGTTLAQQVRPNSVFQKYIECYASTAQIQMQKHGIPASITLAQGLLESAAGQSMLATKANNHFGIKVSTDWTGPYVLRDDDKPNERFRSYNSVEESFEDHSLFLKRPRYQSLFNLSITDYKSWARGLKACGYATSPTYAEKLIEIIECYNLQQYDTRKGERVDSSCQTVLHPAFPTNQHEQRNPYPTRYDRVLFCNNCRYIIVQPCETWKSIGLVYGRSERKLRSMNEYPKGTLPQVGAPLYLDKKSTRAAKVLKGKYHIVKAGESLHSISQMYGMRMKTLYKVNCLPIEYTPKPGDALLLR